MAAAGAKQREDAPDAEELTLLLSRARRILWTAAARALDREGESVFAYNLLATLHRCGPATQRDLAEKTGQHPAAISRLVEELGAGKLVKTARDERDRRRVVVALTAKGAAKLARLRPGVREALEDAAAGVSGSERAVLRGLLEKVAGG